MHKKCLRATRSRQRHKAKEWCTFVAIYATTPSRPSFREASKHRLKSPTYATKEASYVCRRHSLGRLALIWSSPSSPSLLLQGLPDNKGRGQSRGLRPSRLDCKAVEGVPPLPEVTVSLAHIPTFLGISCRNFFKG